MNSNLKKTLKDIIISRIPQIALILILLLIATGIETLVPWPFKILIDNVLGNELLDTKTFIGHLINQFSSTGSAGLFVVVFYFSIVTLDHVANYFYSLWNNLVIQKITRAFATACFTNLTKLDYSYFRKKNVGTYIYKLNYDITAPADIIESSILPIISSSVYLGITIFILASINLMMAAISLAVLPFLSFSMYYMNKKISAASNDLEHKNGALYTFVEQTISQLKIIQAYTQSHSILKNYENTVWKSLLTELKLYRYSIILTLVNGIIIGILYTVIISIGIQRVDAGTLSSGLLIVFIFYMDNVISPIKDIIGSISSYKQSFAQLKNTADIFNPQYHLKDTGTLTSLKNYLIEFKDVTIKDDKGRKILSDISFTAPEKLFTVIIGKSGSGKSSLFQLLLRLTDSLDSGKIEIGGHLLKEYTVQTLRNHIAYVPQESELFDESISRVISFGKENATAAEIREAAKLAVADEFIDKRAGGYQSRVGEGGNFLSGGERQRLLLARAYLRGADILLLDEILSAQDAATQAKIMEGLREYGKNKTVLMITHTYALLLPKDHVIVIEDGKIFAEGTYQELCRKNKLPSQLDT